MYTRIMLIHIHCITLYDRDTYTQTRAHNMLSQEKKIFLFFVKSVSIGPGPPCMYVSEYERVAPSLVTTNWV